MAKEVSVLVTCDWHDDKTPAIETVEFGYDGWTYTLDLCADHLATFNDSIGRFTAAASKSKGVPSVKRGHRSTGAAAATKELAFERVALREWARANGFDIGLRGRISATIRDAYAAAAFADAAIEPAAPAVIAAATKPRSSKTAQAAKKPASSAKKRAGRKAATNLAGGAKTKAVHAGKRPARKAATSLPAATGNVRSWAHANGYQIGDRGRIPVDVREAYEAAVSDVAATG